MQMTTSKYIPFYCVSDSQHDQPRVHSEHTYNITVNPSGPWTYWANCTSEDYFVPPVLADANPQPINGTCGVKGWDNGKVGSYEIPGIGFLSTRSGCWYECAGGAGGPCAAFAYGDGNCLLYRGKMEDLTVDPGSPYTFYDMDCLVEVPYNASTTAVAHSATSSSVS
jgi:hypothetical protein